MAYIPRGSGDVPTGDNPSRSGGDSTRTGGGSPDPINQLPKGRFTDPYDIQTWLEIYNSKYGFSNDEDYQNEFLANMAALAGEQRQRDWALADREHQELYDDPSQQLARLMATGMSRQAAMQALSAGATAMPTNPQGAQMQTGAAASASAQKQANIVGSIGTAASFVPFIGQAASAACQIAAQSIVSNVESQYNGLVNAGYNLPKEFSGSPERQKQFLAACAGQGSDFPDWISSWLNDDSNAEAREACAKVFNSDAYQRLLTGGGFVTRAARQLYRETFRDWISTRGFNAIETDADLIRQQRQAEYLATNLDNIVRYSDALGAALNSLTMEQLSGFAINLSWLKDNPDRVGDTDWTTYALSSDGTTAVPNPLQQYINMETGQLTDDAPMMLRQYFAEVAFSAQMAIQSNDPEIINGYFERLKADNRSKIAALTLQASLSNENGDMFKALPDWVRAAFGFIGLLNVSGVTDGVHNLTSLLPSYSRSRGTINGQPYSRTTWSK